MQMLTMEDFADWVGHPCEVTVGEVKVTMVLAAAEPLPGSPREGGGFRLDFNGPPEPVLGQSIMDVAGPDAVHEIFLVPIGRDAQATRYEAVFY